MARVGRGALRARVDALRKYFVDVDGGRACSENILALVRGQLGLALEVVGVPRGSDLYQRVSMA